MDEDYSRSKEIGDLKEDYKELQMKTYIMMVKLKKLTEEGKENEADIDKLTLNIKKYKESGNGKSAFRYFGCYSE